MSVKNSKIHPTDSGSHIAEIWETGSELGLVMESPAKAKSHPRLTIIDYLNGQKWNVDDLKHRRVTIFSKSSPELETSDEYVGMIEQAKLNGKDAVLDVRFSEKQDHNPGGKLANRITVIQINISKTGKITLGDQEILKDIHDIKILPQTLFTKIETAKERFCYLGKRVVEKTDI